MHGEIESSTKTHKEHDMNKQQLKQVVIVKQHIAVGNLASARQVLDFMIRAALTTKSKIELQAIRNTI
jgi:hypothetical protein